MISLKERSEKSRKKFEKSNHKTFPRRVHVFLEILRSTYILQMHFIM
jgi:hypothetical protein